jgi:ribose-phosphate pyrophosphokinase
MKLLAGSSNLPLAQKVSAKLGLPLVEVETATFTNGERRIWIQEQLAGEDVVIIQSFSNPVDEHIMEFLLLADATERLGARNIHAVIPWLGYSLQDKVFMPGEPIAAKVVANLVSTANINRVYLLDLHNSSTPGFFSIPSAHLSAMSLFVDEVHQRFAGKNLSVASPDFGGLKRARQFASVLETDLVNIDKTRDLRTGEVTAVGLQGSVKDKVVLLFDDVIVSGSTVVETSELLKQEGATEVHFFATHGPLVPEAIQKLANSSIDSLFVTNSIQHTELPENCREVDISGLIVSSLQEWL